MTITDEQQHGLRKPFDPKTIGKLPKGGVMLDFVGHAAVTDRLLSVDPAWTWEPVALGDDGLPAYDRAGGLWIRLTVCGVTRLGYGDGPDPKQRIGDAIRNAALRFGVALDLWSKTELEGADPNGGDAASTPVVNVIAHNATQVAPVDDAQVEAEWFAGFVDYLLAGPQEQGLRPAAQFYAKAIAAGAKHQVLNKEITDPAGTPMTVRQLIEQEQLRLGIAA